MYSAFFPSLLLKGTSSVGLMIEPPYWSVAFKCANYAVVIFTNKAAKKISISIPTMQFVGGGGVTYPRPPGEFMAQFKLGKSQFVAQLLCHCTTLAL